MIHQMHKMHLQKCENFSRCGDGINWKSFGDACLMPLQIFLKFTSGFLIIFLGCFCTSSSFVAWQDPPEVWKISMEMNVKKIWKPKEKRYIKERRLIGIQTKISPPTNQSQQTLIQAWCWSEAHSLSFFCLHSPLVNSTCLTRSYLIRTLNDGCL